MQRRMTRLLEPRETARLIFSTRVGTGFLNERRSIFFFGSCLPLVMASILIGCVMAFLDMIGAGKTAILIAISLFFLLLLAAGAAVLISRLYDVKQTFCFTDWRLIVVSNKPGVAPRTIPYTEITRLAVSVWPDALSPDPRPEEVRFAEYADRFNHPERWPRVGGMRDWLSTLHYPLPTTGKIRFYVGEEMLVQLHCAWDLRQRIERIRRLIGRTIEIEGPRSGEDEEA